MLVSQKCRYALRAIFELARRRGMGAAKNSEIAQAQGIPPRFLEIILGQLKRGGYVASKRGSSGGYVLLHDPAELAVGSVIRFVQGPIDPAEDLAPGSAGPGAWNGPSALAGMWQRVRKSISDVYDTTTFQDLLDEEARLCEEGFVPSYAI